MVPPLQAVADFMPAQKGAFRSSR